MLFWGVLRKISRFLSNRSKGEPVRFLFSWNLNGQSLGRRVFFSALTVVGFAFLLSFFVAGAALWMAMHAPGRAHKEIVLTVPYGSSTKSVARLLAEHHIVHDAFSFQLAARLQGSSARLKSGEYAFSGGQTVFQALSKLVRGEVVRYQFTIPEGLTTLQIVKRIENLPELEGTVSYFPPEGHMLPDSYSYTRGEQRNTVIKRMEQSMHDLLTDLWPKRAKGLPIENQEQALVLASIVERETGRDDERPLIAGVFYNRLRADMRLQSDPTLIYFLSGGTGVLGHALRRSELRKPSPFNTYLNRGLPPGAIANPGRKSLEAVLQPYPTRALFFVADGKGGHYFSRTIAEHNRYVAQLRARERSRKNK